MTKALDIINRGYSLLGYKAAGESLSGEDSSYALDILNTMIDSWNTQNQFIPSIDDVVAIVGGVSATVGPSMQFNTAVPVSVANGAFSRLNGVDYEMKEITRQEYAQLTLKTVTSTFPQYFYYESKISSGTISFYPAVLGTIEVHLPINTYIVSFADTGTDYKLPPGYVKALAYSLAEDLAPGIKELPASVVRQAMNARRAIRRSNVEVAKLDSGVENVRFNIYSGL